MDMFHEILVRLSGSIHGWVEVRLGLTSIACKSDFGSREIVTETSCDHVTFPVGVALEVESADIYVNSVSTRDIEPVRVHTGF